MAKKKEDHSLRNLFLTLLFIVLLSFAIGSFFRGKLRPQVQTEYSNGFTFTQAGKFWYTTVRNPVANQDYNMEFRYAPSQVKNITVHGNPRFFFNLLKQGNLTGAYITFNFTQNASYATTLAAADLSKFLKVINGVSLNASCTSNETLACHTRPVVTCENQDDRAVVIFVKNSETSAVTMYKNCLTIEGKDEGLVKAYTKLLFLWYNVL